MFTSFLCSLYARRTLPRPHPPLIPALRPLASERLFQKAFFHLHHLQEAHTAQNNTDSARGFSLSPHFSCVLFPWVVPAVTVFIPLPAFAHTHLSACI